MMSGMMVTCVECDEVRTRWGKCAGWKYGARCSARAPARCRRSSTEAMCTKSALESEKKLRICLISRRRRWDLGIRVVGSDEIEEHEKLHAA